jgi:hypothetical protein
LVVRYTSWSITLPRTNRSVARRYADLSRRRKNQSLTRSDGLEAPTIEREVERHEDEAVVERAAAGGTTLRIAPQIRIGGPPRRVSTFDTADYSYVLSDLRRVAVVAGVLLAILIVLSFFVR